MKKIHLPIISFLFIASLSHAGTFTLSNFKTPESFVVDEEEGYYYVSNINGNHSVKDTNGFISKVSPSRNSVIQLFIGNYGDSNLNAPKGLLILGEDLFVTDIDTVKVFNKKTGKPKAVIDCSKFGASFLNDIAVDGKNLVYVSDTDKNQIIVIDPSMKYKAELYIRSRDLGNPNGLRFNPKTKNLVVVTFGSGQILEIDKAKKIHVLKRGLSSLDGVDYDHEGNLYVSSFLKGEIYKIANFGRGAVTTFASGLVTPADISCDRQKGTILIPSFNGNTVAIVSLQKDKPAAPVAPKKV